MSPMTRPVRAACGLVTSLVAAAGLSLAAQTAGVSAPDSSGQTFRAGTEAVLVDVYPQKNGQIVTGLTQDQFAVFEDGKPQKIESLQFVRVEPRGAEPAHADPNTVAEMRTMAADPHVRLFAVYLDTTHTTFSGGSAIRRPLLDFLDRAIGPDDLFGAMVPAMRPSDLAFGRHAESIQSTLAALAANAQRDRSDTDPTDPMEETLKYCFASSGDGADPVPKLLERRREDRVLTSLEDLVKYLGGLREARTVVLVVTDGWLLYQPDPSLTDLTAKIVFGRPGATSIPTPRLPGRPVTAAQQDPSSSCLSEANRLASLDDQQKLRDIIQLASQNNVSFYPVASGGLSVFDTDIVHAPQAASGPGGPPLSQSMSNVRDRVGALRTLADGTGGLAVVDTNDLAGGLERASNDVSAYYLLTYYSTNDKRDGRYRRIEVKVKTPGLSVRARPGYTSDVAARAAAPPPAATTPTGVAAALARLRPEPPDLATSVRRTPGAFSIVAELGSAVAGRPEWSDGGTVSVDIMSSSGERLAGAQATIGPGARSAAIEVPFTETAPVQVRTKVATRGAAFEDRLDVAMPMADALLGDPLMSRATPSPRSPLWPVAGYEFRRTERLHVDVPLLAAVEQRTVRLLDRKGQPLAVTPAVSDRDLNGQRGLAIDLNLVPLADGDYVIEIEAVHGSLTDRTLVAFRVAG
jgi:VWFA-related protein